jgi:hypothetical protein
LPRRLLLLTLVVGAVGLVFVFALGRELLTSRPLPPPPAARTAQPAPAAGPVTALARSPGGDLGAYNLIPERNLFNPTRSESSVVAARGPMIKPLLHGVVLDGPRSRAYLEDPAAKRVFSYIVGDTLGPGRIETIGADRVVIASPEGSFEVLLRDPSKPRPAPPAAAAAPGAPGAPAATPAAAAPTPPGAPVAQSAPTAPGVPPAQQAVRIPRVVPNVPQIPGVPRQPRNPPGIQRRGLPQADD